MPLDDLPLQQLAAHLVWRAVYLAEDQIWYNSAYLTLSEHRSYLEHLQITLLSLDAGAAVLVGHPTPERSALAFWGDPDHIGWLARFLSVVLAGPDGRPFSLLCHWWQLDRV